MGSALVREFCFSRKVVVYLEEDHEKPINFSYFHIQIVWKFLPFNTLSRKKLKASVLDPQRKSTFKIITKLVVFAICRRSMKGYPAWLRIVRFADFPSFKTELLCWAKLFFVTHSRFLTSTTLMWYHYCNRNRSSGGRPEARGQVRARPHTLSIFSNTIMAGDQLHDLTRSKRMPYTYAKCL